MPIRHRRPYCHGRGGRHGVQGGPQGLNLILGFITCYANLYVPRGLKARQKFYLSWFKGGYDSLNDYAYCFKICPPHNLGCGLDRELLWLA